MLTAAVIGAGSLGGALAHTLAARERFRAVRLIDPAGDVASGKALDILQSGPVVGFSTRVVGARHTLDAIGADVIVLADGASIEGPDLDGDDGLATIRSLVAHGCQAPIICAGSRQAVLVERATRELQLPATRVLASSPTAFAAAAKALVALDLDASPTDVTLLVIGRAPDRLFVPWSQAAVGGVPVEARLASSQLASIADRLTHLWPPGPYALASAAARVGEAIVIGSPRTFSCVVRASGAAGRDQAASVAVQLGPAGRVRVTPLALTQQERVTLDNALAATR